MGLNIELFHAPKIFYSDWIKNRAKYFGVSHKEFINFLNDLLSAYKNHNFFKEPEIVLEEDYDEEESYQELEKISLNLKLKNTKFTLVNAIQCRNLFEQCAGFGINNVELNIKEIKKIYGKRKSWNSNNSSKEGLSDIEKALIIYKNPLNAAEKIYQSTLNLEVEDYNFASWQLVRDLFELHLKETFGERKINQ